MERQRPVNVESVATPAGEGHSPETTVPGLEPGAEHPRGSLFLLLVYLIVVIAIWGTVYLTMLERG